MKLTSEQLEEAGRAFRKIEIRGKDTQYDLFDPNKMMQGNFYQKWKNINQLKKTEPTTKKTKPRKH